MTSAALSLDAIVTAIACLCSTTNVREEQVSTLLRLNNHSTPQPGFWNQSFQLKVIEERLSNLELKLDRMEKMLKATLQPSNSQNIVDCEPLTLKEDEYKGIDYEIPGLIPFIAVCENVKDQGNWLLIQRRVSDRENFYRNWQDYKTGFGSLEYDYFIGLERMHKITTGRPHKLLIILKQNLVSTLIKAHYDRFEIDSEENGYALKTLGKYHGTTNDLLRPNLNKKFTTFDRDNDSNTTHNCAEVYHGAWWFDDCRSILTHLNGEYLTSGRTDLSRRGIIWSSYSGLYDIYSRVFERVEMLIKPLN